MNILLRGWGDIAGLIFVAVLLGGCTETVSPEDSSRSLESTERPAPSEIKPVEEDAFPQQQLLPLREFATRAQVEEASRAGSSAQAAEQFALLAAQYFTDARGDEITLEDVQGIVRASDAVTRYVVTDQASQVQMGTNRRLDPSVSGWVRSTWIGGATETALRTQWFAYLRGDISTDESVAFWVNFRVDVELHDGHWVVTQFVNGAGPDGKKPTKEALDRYFDGGKGWRRIPVA